MASKTDGYWWPGIKESVAKVLKARISQENSVNIMTADALAPCVARTPAAMVFETDGTTVINDFVIHGVSISST